MFWTTLIFLQKMPKMPVRMQLCHFVRKIAVLELRVHTLVKIFLPHEMDVNSYFCLKKQLPGRLLKDQERFSRHVNFYWQPGLTLPGVHKFSYFFAKCHNLNISFEKLKIFYSKPIQWISKNARQNATLAFFQKNRCTRAERAYSRTNG